MVFLLRRIKKPPLNRHRMRQDWSGSILHSLPADQTGRQTHRTPPAATQPLSPCPAPWVLLSFCFFNNSEVLTHLIDFPFNSESL